MDTILTSPQWSWNETNTMCFTCRLSALIRGYVQPTQVNGVGLTVVCICAPPLKRPKVMGQLASQLFHGQVCDIPSLPQLQCMDFYHIVLCYMYIVYNIYIIVPFIIYSFTVDPGAIWMLQGWLFVNNPTFWRPVQIKALLHGVPIGRIIVLDLFAETIPVYQTTESFYGQPFIWCMLHNFGGNHGLFGKVESINKGPFDALLFTNSTMIGTGLTPEGIEQNDMIYELMNEIGWRSKPLNLTEWITDYSDRRYGQKHPSTRAAWQLLLGSVYNCTQYWKDHNHSPLVRRPSLKMNTDFCYNKTDLYAAWKLMHNAASSLANSSTFLYDLVDITREAIQLLVTEYYQEIKTAYLNEDLERVMTAGGLMVFDLLPELDRLLSSQSQFLLGRWLESAQKTASTKDEAILYDMNARNQITLWGPTGNILDYANKQLGGLIKDYYKKRWSLFLWYLIESLNTEVPFQQSKFDKVVFPVESGFIYNGKTYSSTPTGDTIAIAKNIFIKYFPKKQ